MKIGIIALATLLATGLVALDGVLENVGEESLLTGSAVAECVEDIDGSGCVSLCVPPPKPDLWYCTM